MKKIFWTGFWFIYFPVIFILSILLGWNKKVRFRLRFERKNKYEFLAHSFKEVNQKADLCFEFSSEGEYQQVAPLIKDALELGKKIELVFFSPSVEKTIVELALLYPDQIRYLRYPFLNLFPFIQTRCFCHWITAQNLVMVRYDFFPEFFLWSLSQDNNLKIVWVTFKKERITSKKVSFWKIAFLKNARRIVYSGISDQHMGVSFGLPGGVFDFRLIQIHRRIENKDEKLKNNFNSYSQFQKFMSAYPKRLIMGNIWPSDIFLLKLVPRDTFILLAPHDFSPEVLNDFYSELNSLGLSFSVYTDNPSETKLESTVLLKKKGVLCELYADFDFAYVGGGFHKSIHSVLEPLVAGCRYISCGPAHHRSTEYDIAFDNKSISEVKSPEDFYQWLCCFKSSSSRESLNEYLNKYSVMREVIISC